MNSIRRGYLSCFLAGVLITIGLLLAKNVLGLFLFCEPVVCRTSFPRIHTACVYSRFGFGEQAVSLSVDDKTVFSVDDFIPGNLNENITWTSGARNVIFHVDGLGDMKYDAESKIRVLD